MKKRLMFSLVVVTALLVSLALVLAPVSGPVQAAGEGLQAWLDDNGYTIDVTTDELGKETFEPGVYLVTILDGEHGYMNPTGWYTAGNASDIHLIFPGPIADGDKAYANSAEEFGFYIDSNDGTFYTENDFNGDGFDHAWVFPNEKGNITHEGYIVCFEDLINGGDEDYEDRIIKMERDTDEDYVPDEIDNCPDVYNPLQEDWDLDGAGDACDGCPNDPNKTEPGVCGCGVPDTDSDSDGVADCNDNCPEDPDKTEPGLCGCGVADTDSDGDGTADCNDGCPNDPDKTAPGVCGCSVADTDTDGDGIADCNDNCPDVPNPDQADSNGNGIGDACEQAQPPVGGTIFPTDKLGLVMPWIIAAGALIVIAGVLLAIHNRKLGIERASDR